MNETVSAGGTCHRLVLTGDLTIRGIDDIHAMLRDAMMQHDAIEIDCMAAEGVDLSFVQLLLSAHKSADRSGKTLKLAQPATGRLLDVLARGGFLDDAGNMPGAARLFLLGSGDKA